MGAFEKASMGVSESGKDEEKAGPAGSGLATMLIGRQTTFTQPIHLHG